MAQVVGMLQGDIEMMAAHRDGLYKNVNDRPLLGLNSSTTTLTPVDEESRVLYMGENSDSRSYNRPTPLIELGAIKTR